MLPKNRDIVINRIKEELVEISNDNQRVKEFVQGMTIKYDIPLKLSSDMVRITNIVDVQPDTILFCIVSQLKLTEYLRYFTDFEQRKYKDFKASTETDIINQFKVIEVEQDHYIGRIKARELLSLANAGLLTYDENAQRQLTKKKKNNVEVYLITINKRSIKEILNLLKRKEFIPNAITLNISEDLDPVYDDETNTLTINTNVPGGYLNIVDGYHRYVALTKACIEDPNFDYDMELRLFHFGTEKQKQFIYQEDKRNPMSKAHVESLNQNSKSVKVIHYLKKRDSFIDKCISPGGIIEQTHFVADLKQYYGSNGDIITSDNYMKEVSSQADLLLNFFMELIAKKPEIFENKWNHIQMAAAILCALEKLDIKSFDKIVENTSTAAKFYYSSMRKLI